jgi:CheY-like chemotaxis protein
VERVPLRGAAGPFAREGRRMSADSPPSILIVDDVPANLQLLSGMLTAHGFKARPATNGSMALEAARRVPPDLILLDITMPGMDGFEVCRRLKADANLADIPGAVHQRPGGRHDKVRAFEQGGRTTSPSRFMWRRSWPGCAPIWPCAGPRPN